MANQEHLDILKQGVKVWNDWRKEHSGVVPDLSKANLVDADLRRIYIWRSYIEGVNLRLGKASPATPMEFDLEGADLRGIELYGARLTGANLAGADLREAKLTGANLVEANLREANFSSAVVGGTIFGNLDLSTARGLETIVHGGPSVVGIDTIYRSGGNIPEPFLRGTGIPETFITYARSLVNSPIEYYTCFISYSSHDQAFAERLYADLQSKNVRCWYAPEDLKIGDKFRMCIDESIHLYDKLLLILSEHSVNSPWVEKEVETAFEKEHQSRKLTLFPVKLDNTVMETDQAWTANIRRTRHIGDFTRWKEHDEYQKGLSRLLRDLKQEVAMDKT